MRISPYLREYWNTEKQFREKNMEIPAQLKEDFKAKEYLDNHSRLLHACADGNAISNATWRFLQELYENRKNHHNASKWADRVDAAQREMALLYADLKKAENGFLIDGNTLSKEGSKRVRESANRIGDMLRER